MLHRVFVVVVGEVKWGGGLILGGCLWEGCGGGFFVVKGGAVWVWRRGEWRGGVCRAGLCEGLKFGRGLSGGVESGGAARGGRVGRAVVGVCVKKGESGEVGGGRLHRVKE